VAKKRTLRVGNLKKKESKWDRIKVGGGTERGLKLPEISTTTTEKNRKKEKRKSLLWKRMKKGGKGGTQNKNGN